MLTWNLDAGMSTTVNMTETHHGAREGSFGSRAQGRLITTFVFLVRRMRFQGPLCRAVLDIQAPSSFARHLGRTAATVKDTSHAGRP